MNIKRNSNIEFLRIFSMLLIICSHFCVHNEIIKSSLPLGINRFLLEFFSLGNIGVIIFILITGYFGVKNNTPFKLKRFIILILQTFFYSFVIYIVFVVSGKTSFSLIGFIKALLPITFKTYWFMTSYIILYIFMPYINKLINSINRKEHKNLCLICIIIFYFLSTLTTSDFYGNQLIQFFSLYIIGAFIGKYKYNILNNKSKCLLLCLSSLLIIVISIISFDLVGTKYSVIGEHSNYLLNRNSIVALMFSIGLFGYVINIKEKNNQFICSLSKYVLGVYLIHDNYYIRALLWTSIFNIKTIINSKMFFLYFVLIVLLIFIVCILIEWIRFNLIDKLLIKIYDKHL